MRIMKKTVAKKATLNVYFFHLCTVLEEEEDSERLMLAALLQN